MELYVARSLGLKTWDKNGKKIETMTILEEADALIHGDRRARYGPVEQDFKRIAAMWTGLLMYKLREGESIEFTDVPWMMGHVKASRAQHSDHKDNYRDNGGYSGCGWDCVEVKIKEQKKAARLAKKAKSLLDI